MERDTLMKSDKAFVTENASRGFKSRCLENMPIIIGYLRRIYVPRILVTNGSGKSNLLGFDKAMHA